MTRGGALPHHRVASSLIQINRFMHRRDLETARRLEKRKRQFPTLSLTKTNGIALRASGPPYLRCIPLEPCPRGYRLPTRYPSGERGRGG